MRSDGRFPECYDSNVCSLGDVSLMAMGDERAALLTLAATNHLEPRRVVRLIEQAGSALAILAGDLDRLEHRRRADAAVLARHADRAAIPSYERQIERLRASGTLLVTILDRGYPFNLRDVPDRPPFVFVQGRLTSADDYAVAIASDEADTPESVARCRELVAQLVAAEVTIVAEAGRPIGDVALAAALDAGGRAIGVLDHGVEHGPARVSPTLAKRVRARGALVSPCWPDTRPSESSRAAAQVVACGVAGALVVFSGPSDSLNRRHARRCLEQHQKLLLDESLVLHEPWAKIYSDHPAITVIRSAGDVLEALSTAARLRARVLDGDSGEPEPAVDARRGH
jgi:DNA processing protein